MRLTHKSQKRAKLPRPPLQSPQGSCRLFFFFGKETQKQKAVLTKFVVGLNLHSVRFGFSGSIGFVSMVVFRGYLIVFVVVGLVAVAIAIATNCACNLFLKK